MELLQKTYAQLADVVKSMTPGARLVAGAVLCVVLASLGYLLNQQVSPRQSYLLGGEMFSVSQLREMQMALGKAGLEATVEGARVKVPHGQESKYMAALAESGALPDFGGYLKKAVNGSGFMAYGPQQEARTKIAIQSELQLVISQMKGIESASVLIDQETRRGFREANLVTASVGVRPRGTGSLDEQTVAAIRSFVASAWAGLKPEAVTVVDLSGPRLFPGTGGGESKPGAVVGSYSQNKKQLELDWQEKIERLLAPMVAGALVTTNVELDPEVSNEEKSTQITGPAHEGQSPSAGPTTEKRIVREGRTPKRVTVSVAVPHTYYEEIWRKQRPAGRRRLPSRAGCPSAGRDRKRGEEENRSRDPALAGQSRPGGRPVVAGRGHDFLPGHRRAACAAHASRQRHRLAGPELEHRGIGLPGVGRIGPAEVDDEIAACRGAA